VSPGRSWRIAWPNVRHGAACVPALPSLPFGATKYPLTAVVVLCTTRRGLVVVSRLATEIVAPLVVCNASVYRPGAEMSEVTSSTSHSPSRITPERATTVELTAGAVFQVIVSSPQSELLTRWTV
jgi:hypothetical protein